VVQQQYWYRRWYKQEVPVKQVCQKQQYCVQYQENKNKCAQAVVVISAARYSWLFVPTHLGTPSMLLLRFFGTRPGSRAWDVPGRKGGG